MATYRVPVLRDFHWQPSVKDKDLTDEPGAGILKGDRYIVKAVAGSDWAGQEDAIATATQADPTEAGHWIFDAPSEGWTCWVDDENEYYVYDGANWIRAAGAELNSVSSQLVSAQSDITVIISDISSHTIQIASLESKQVVDLAELNSVSSQLVSAQSDITVKTSDISSHTIQIASLESKQVVDLAELNSVSSQLVSAQSDITVNTSDISSHTIQIASAQEEGTYVAEYGAIEFTI